MPTGKKLIEEINNCRTIPGEIAFWWLGQQSYVVKGGEIILYFDPFLSDHPRRQIQSLLRAEEVDNATIIFGSHDHTDHIDRKIWPDLAKASPEAIFVVPEIWREDLISDLGIPEKRFLGVTAGDQKELSGINITVIASAHELFHQDEATGLFPFLGFLVEINGCKIYHPGDSCKYEGLETKLIELQPDIMFLPINGRDAVRLARGCIGNMTYQEAVDLAGAVSPELVIPGHYEMFENNSEDPQLFVDYLQVKYPDQKTILPKHGELQKFECRS